MSNVKKILPDSDAIKQRFPDGDIISLDLVDGWDELDEEQQRYMIEYVRWFPKKMQSAMKAGIKTYKVSKWFSESEPFITFANVIRSLYSESLHYMHLEDAKENPKIRAGELRALDAEGWKKESKKGSPQNQQNNYFFGDKPKGGLGNLVEAVNKNKGSED